MYIYVEFYSVNKLRLQVQTPAMLCAFYMFVQVDSLRPFCTYIRAEIAIKHLVNLFTFFFYILFHLKCAFERF